MKKHQHYDSITGMDNDALTTKVLTALQQSPLRTHVRKLSLFGSYLHGTAHEDSDIDLLIEFSAPVSLFQLIRMELDMSKEVGKKSDLVTPQEISKYLQDDVLETAQTLYEQS